MKKHLILIVMALIMGASAANAQTYHISRYRWGVQKWTINWGRYLKGGFDVLVDTTAQCVIVNNKHIEKYRILNEHPALWEKDNLKYEGKSFCLLDDCDRIYHLYFREKDGLVVQLVIADGSKIWAYDISGIDDNLL